jgi:Spy/CpxP family protein refolding chaperone
MMRPRWRSVVLGVLGVTLVSAAPLDGQRGPRRGEMGQDRQQLERRIRAQMGRMMRERLGLTDEEATRLSEVVQGFEGQRRALFRQEQATRRRVEALLLEDAPDPVEATELLERMADLRAQEAELFATEQRALLEVLTPMQVLELQSLREQIGRRIRALRGRRDGRAGERGPPGGSVPPGEGMDPLVWLPGAGFAPPGR